jgi:hypothetical protein
MKLFLIQALFITCCHGFAAVRAPADLVNLGAHVYSKKLNFRVAVGNKEEPFQMKDMHVELTGSLKTPKRSSTGIHTANLLRPPYYIDQKGEQAVALQNGGWEIVWGKKSPHGHLTCSFVSLHEVRRTDEGAKLEAGRFFLNHRVWTRETLESERERRRQIQAEAAKHIDERDKRIREITDEETSLGSKVVSYAQAAKSMNDYWVSGYNEALYIPLYDDQVLELAPDLILSTRGEVFKINGRNAECIGQSRVEFLKLE